MALSTRTVTISLRFPTAQSSATITFVPDLTAGDGQVLLEKFYSKTLTASPAATTLTATIDLPVLTDPLKAIGYRVKFPRETGYNEHYIYLSEGDPVDLADLIETALGQEAPTVPITDSLMIGSALFMGTSVNIVGPTADQQLVSISASDYRSVKYQVQVTSDSDIHVTEIRVFHDGTNCTITEYGVMFTQLLATFSVEVNNGSLRLLTTPTSGTKTYKVLTQALKI